jgi:hypothetical protein
VRTRESRESGETEAETYPPGDSPDPQTPARREYETADYAYQQGASTSGIERKKKGTAEDRERGGKGFLAGGSLRGDPEQRAH